MLVIQCAESTGNGSANNEIHICSQVAADILNILEGKRIALSLAGTKAMNNMYLRV